MKEVRSKQVAVRFAPSASSAHRGEVADACGLVPLESVDAAGFVVHEISPKRTHKLDRVRHPQVEQVRPVFTDGKRRWFASHRVLIGMAHGARRTANGARRRGHGYLRQLIRAGARLVRENHGTVLLELHRSHDLEAEVRKIARLRGVEFVEPEYIVLGRQHHSAQPASGLAINQAPLRLIDAAAGWKSGVASKKITIAVLDCGVMRAHPDLRAAIGATFDATTGKSNQSPPPWDSHGTSCAGLATGTHVKAAGVKGVADGCTLMAVRIGKTPTRLGSYVTKTSWICRGIDWAWEHGADVLSMSYGGGPRSAAVVAALARARKQGRKGKGTVLIASAGNGATAKTPVEFPATLPWVCAVAATDDHDRPKRALSNQQPWISASGAAVDIAAPGVGCYTTTVPDPTEGETALYTTAFSGTSASTPLVAGAAALVLSANPGLTEQAVRRLLTTTADKVRTVTYRRGHSNWVGSGRLNVGAVVRAALASRRS